MRPMRLLKIFTNALLAGWYGGFLLILLIYLVNPEVKLTGPGYFSMVPVIGISYTLLSALFWTLIMVAVRAFWRGQLVPHWVSFRYVVWMLVVNLVFLFTLYSINRWEFRLYLPPDPARIFLLSSTILLGLLGILVFLGLSGHRRATRRHRNGAALFPLVSLLLLLWLRASYPAGEEIQASVALTSGRITPTSFLIAIDSASLDLIVPIAAKGNLPNLARIMREGVHGRLQAFKPATPATWWASLSTGKLPYRHRQFGHRAVRFAGSSVPLGMIPRGLPRRTLISLGWLKPLSPGTLGPGARGIDAILQEMVTSIQFINWTENGMGEPGGAFSRPPVPAGEDPFPGFDSEGPGLSLLRGLVAGMEPIDREDGPEMQSTLRDDLVRAVLGDLDTFRQAETALEVSQPGILGIRLRGLDRVSHRFLRFHMPEAFGNVPPAVISRNGGVLEAYYRFLDDLIGKLMDHLPEEGRFFVFSPNGIEPIGIRDRILNRILGREEASGGNTGAPEGVFFAVGDGIRSGFQLEEASILDLVPTLLYSLSLPVGRDMDGRTRIEIFNPEYTRQHALFRILTYERARFGPPDGPDSP